MANVYYSAAWMNKVDGDVVTYNGGTYTIGTDAFGDYTEAQEVGDVVLCDVYLNTEWTAEGWEEGDTATAVLPSGDEVEIELANGKSVQPGQGVLLASDGKADVSTGVSDAATAARKANSAIYLESGTFLHNGTNASSAIYTYGCKAVVSKSYVSRLTNGNGGGTLAAAPETYIIAGGQVALLRVSNGNADKAYAYIGKDGYAGTINAAYGDGSTFNIVEVEIDGGTFGNFQGTGARITGEMNVTASNGVNGGEVWVSAFTGPGLSNDLVCDINFTVSDSTLSKVGIAGRSVGTSEWYKVCNTTIGDFTLDLTNATVATVYSGTNFAFWCFNNYNVVLDGSTITTLKPKSGGYASLAYAGGTATVQGGTFVTNLNPTYGDENVETVWTDGDFRYLMIDGATKTTNADGTITITNAVYYNGAAASGSQWIKGGTATLQGGTQHLFSLTVEGNGSSYVKTMEGIQSITIDATADLALASNVGADVAIIVDVTDFVLSGASETFLTTTGSISTTNFTVLENGTVSEKYAIQKDGKTLQIVARPVVYTAAWADLDDGSVVVISGNTATIGVDAFGNYTDAMAAATQLGRPLANYDVYYTNDWAGKASGDTVSVVLDGNTVSMKIGEGAYATLAAAQGASNPAAAVVFEGGSYSGTDAGSFQLGGYRTILQGGTYSGTIFGGASGGSCNSIDVTANTATIGSLNANRYVVCNGTINYHVVDSVVGSIHTSSYSQDNATTTVLIENSRVGALSAGFAGNNGVTTVTAVSSTFTGPVGGGGLNNSSNNAGDFNFNFTDVTMTGKGFTAAVGNDGSNWKLSRVTGAITVTVDGTASNFSVFDVRKYVASSISVTVDADALLTATTFNADASQTITIDVTDFSFGAADSKTVISAGNGGLANYNFVVAGTPTDDVSISVTNKAVTLVKKVCYFSEAWEGLENGTTVQTPGGEMTIGTDAFFLYADAKAASDAKGWKLLSADRYFNNDWVGLEAGAEVTVACPSGTFNTTIGDANIPAYNTLDSAKTAAQSANTTLAIVGGTWTMGGRNSWYTIKNTVVTNSRITGTANGAIVTMMAGNSSATYESSFTVGEKSLVSSVGITGNDAGSTFKKITYNVVDGGRVSTAFMIGYTGKITGDVDFNLDGGTISDAYTSITGGTIVGNVNFNLSNGAKIGQLWLAPNSSSTAKLAEGSSINVTLDGSHMLIRDFDKAHTLVKEDGATINVAVKGTTKSNVNFAASSVDSLTIDVGATLALDTNFNYTGTITVNAKTCDYSQGQYLLVSGWDVSNTIEVVNDDSTKNYKIVKVGTNIFYQAPTTYFSVTWAGLESGTKVTVAGKEYTIGTDAFASYDAAVEAGAKLINSADTYLNSAYNSTDPIMIGNYQAKYGIDAFSNSASAIAAAKSMGGALDVTGGNFSGLNVSGIETSFFTNVSTGSGASIWGQTENAEIAGKNMTADNVDCNYFAAVTAGTVTGDVNVAANDLTTYNGLYLVQNAYVGGNVTAVVSGDSYLTKGWYAVEGDTAVVNGDVSITVVGGKIYRRGIQIYGTVNGTATVDVTGNATISSIMDTFDKVTIGTGVELHYGKGLEGDWKNEYLYGFTDLVNNGTLYYDAEIGQNAYAMLYKNVSGTGTIELGDNVSFVNGGTTYVAEMQQNVLVNSEWTGKEMFETVEVNGEKAIIGVSAFADKTAAQVSGLTNDATIFVNFGEYIEGNAYGENGQLGFAGGTVTGNAYAGEIKTASTVDTDSAVKVLGVSADPGSFGSLIGGYKVTADAAINANSTLTVTGTDNVSGKALVGGSYVDGVNVEINGTSNVTVGSGSFSNALIGGSLVNGSGSVFGNYNTNVTLSGGTVKVLGGGCYLQGGGSIDITGTSTVTISGGAVVGSVFGGNFANTLEYATKDASLWNGDTNITINATESVVIGGNVVAGSYGKGMVSGSSTLTFTGNGDKLQIAGHITGDSSNGDDSDGGRRVMDTRTLAFDSFSGNLGTAIKKVTGFDAVSLDSSTVSLAGYGMLKSVSDWSITDSTLDWSKGANDFSNDKLTLVSTNEIGTDGWTVFQLGDGLTTGWNAMTLDKSGTAKVSLTVAGVEHTLVGVKEEQTGPVVYYADANYKFYKDDNALKVAKLA